MRTGIGFSLPAGCPDFGRCCRGDVQGPALSLVPVSDRLRVRGHRCGKGKAGSSDFGRNADRYRFFSAGRLSRFRKMLPSGRTRTTLFLFPYPTVRGRGRSLQRRGRVCHVSEGSAVRQMMRKASATGSRDLPFSRKSCFGTFGIFLAGRNIPCGRNVPYGARMGPANRTVCRFSVP